MRKTLLLVLILVLAAGVFGGCSNTSPTNSNSTAPSDSNSTTVVTPSDSSNLVQIKDYKFNPETLTIKAGDTVEWQNNDSVTHTVKFDNFESEGLKQGGTYKHTFDTQGTYNYICGPHPYMKGTIIVQ